MGSAIAILAGNGEVPVLVANSASASGHTPIVFAITGESSPAIFSPHKAFSVRWGELGRLFRILYDTGCDRVIFVGAISRRPDLGDIRPDLGTLGLLPRVMKLLRDGDNSLLTGIAAIFAERGVRLVSPVDVAPELVLPEQCLTAALPDKAAAQCIAAAAQAARLLGSLDIGQAAIAVAGRVVAVEGAEGTDGLLERVAAMRQTGRIPSRGGVLVKCMKPQQDPRLDVPTIGPRTAELARTAGLDGVAAEAGRTLLAGRAETVAAFNAAGLFLAGIAASSDAADG